MKFPFAPQLWANAWYDMMGAGAVCQFEWLTSLGPRPLVLITCSLICLTKFLVTTCTCSLSLSSEKVLSPRLASITFIVQKSMIKFKTEVYYINNTLFQCQCPMLQGILSPNSGKCMIWYNGEGGQIASLSDLRHLSTCSHHLQPHPPHPYDKVFSHHLYL